MHLLWILFGPSTWGAGGNMVAWVICGALGFGWLHGNEKARHVQKMAQAARHHAEVLGWTEQHHQELMAHVTATAQGQNGATVADRPQSE